MPSDTPNLATIRERLESLVKCLLTHAEKDAVFAEELVQALASVKPVKAAKAKTQIDINLVEILKEQGAEGLIQVLARVSHEELRELAKRYKVATKGKDMPIEQLIECLAQKAKERLGRGGVFLDPESSPAANGDPHESTEILLPSEQEHATPATPAEHDGERGEADVAVPMEGKQEASSESTNA